MKDFWPEMIYSTLQIIPRVLQEIQVYMGVIFLCLCFFIEPRNFEYTAIIYCQITVLEMFSKVKFTKIRLNTQSVLHYWQTLFQLKETWNPEEPYKTLRNPKEPLGILRNSKQMRICQEASDPKNQC